MALFGTLTLNTPGGDIVITVDTDTTVDLPVKAGGWEQDQLRILFGLLDKFGHVVTVYPITGIHFIKA